MAEYKSIPNKYMTIGEVAKKMGVTVRTLQYYDKEGILTPSNLSEGGRRLYSDKDIIKLHQILALKSLGFSLDKIKSHIILTDTPIKAIDVLNDQSKVIKAQIDLLSKSLESIELLKSEIQKMQTVDFSKYADIIINLQMGNKYYGLIKYFDESMLDYCHKKFDKDSGLIFINKFNYIIEKIEKCIKYGVNSTSKQGQAIAKDFWQLIMEFTDGDMSILPKLMNLKKLQNNKEDKKIQTLLNKFIETALGAYFKNSGINPFEV